MPFNPFKKNRPTSLPHELTSSNGSSNKVATPTQTPTFNNSIPIVLPPLHNFVPPDEKSQEAVVRSKGRSTATIEDILSWGRDYFLAFLRSESCDEILEIYERIGVIVHDDECNNYHHHHHQQQRHGDSSSVSKTTARHESSKPPLDHEIHRIKFQIEKSSFSVDLNALNCEENENNVFRWISKARQLIYQSLQEEYLPRFLDSKFHIKCQVDFFTSSESVSLRDILCNHSALFYFMEYVDQENNREVLEFWLGASNFAEQFVTKPGENGDMTNQLDTKTAQSDAMVLYEKYISLQAPHFIGFRDEIRSDVERLICSNDIGHCFDKAMDEAFLFLHVTCLDGFLKSSLFLAFLSDLINSLSPPAHKTHKRSESTSTCSSSSASLINSPIGINSSSLHQPNRSKLSLGRVNSMGKFEAETDLELVKQESGIAKTVKKLVNYDEKEKAKEELAWQVAAMIVNEVTSITCPHLNLNMNV